MKNSKLKIMLLLIISFGMTACLKERIELDKSAWGDQAILTGAVLFRYTEVKNELGYSEPVTGYQNTAITTTSNVVDKNNATITIVAAKGTDVTKMGIRFTHVAEKIEPLDGSPPAGIIADFSKGRFVYRVSSADGTIRNWTIIISVAP